jgi:hypothetical protein
MSSPQPALDPKSPVLELDQPLASTESTIYLDSEKKVVEKVKAALPPEQSQAAKYSVDCSVLVKTPNQF